MLHLFQGIHLFSCQWRDTGTGAACSPDCSIFFFENRRVPSHRPGICAGHDALGSRGAVGNMAHAMVVAVAGGEVAAQVIESVVAA